MKGVIMAGGRGTRLRPLTCDVPKPMVPLVGKPVMEYTIEWLKRFGITDIAVTIQYLGDKIKNYFGDGSRWGVNISYFEESEPLGTAGSVKNVDSFIDDTFIVVSGDALTDFDLFRAIEFHHERHALATILMSREQYPLDYGGIIVSRDGKIQQLIEKPKWSEVYSDFVNTGIYIFEREILRYIEANTPCDFSSDIFPLLLQNNERLYGFLAEGYWLDIGTIQQYRKANVDILNKQVHVSINGEELFPHVWVGPNVRIEDGAVIIGPAFIGDGAVIRKNVNIEPYSVVGVNAQISEYTSVKRSIIWDHVYVGKHCELRGSMIASGTYLANNVELLEQSVVGSHCMLQPHVKVKPNIKIWPKKTIFEGVVVHSSIFWGKQVQKSLFGTRGISGVANIEMTPEYVSKIASAYGSTLSLNSKIIVASDGHPFTNIVKQSLIQGLHSTGVCTVECLESVTAPIVRYQLSQSSYDGGVFMYMNEQERKVYIDVYDENGYPLDRFQERRIEHVLAQEQFRRAPLEQIGFSEYHSRAISSYIQAMQKNIHLPLYDRKAILVSETNIHRLVEEVFRERNGEVIMIKHTNSDDIAEYVRTTKSLFALVAQNNGEQFIVIDEKGNILTEEQLLSIYTIVTLLFHTDRCAPIPNYAPSTLETIADRLNGQVKRIKGNRRDMLFEMSHSFHFCYDAVYAFTQLFQLLSFETRSLSQLVESIPHVHWLRDYVFCPWSARGVVMRKLMEDEMAKKVDVNDGIKVYHPDGGWTFILPELDQPAFTIYSQAADVQKARETMTHYIKKIRQYQKA